jgi:hypothetical protein
MNELESIINEIDCKPKIDCLGNHDWYCIDIDSDYSLSEPPTLIDICLKCGDIK